MLQCYSRMNAGTHKRERKALHVRQPGLLGVSALTLQVNGALVSEPQPETTRRWWPAEKSQCLFWGLFKETSRGQSWLTQFSATSVESRLKMKEEKNNHVSRHQQACIMGMWNNYNCPCMLRAEAAKLILHESLSLGCYRDIMFHFSTLQLRRSFHSQSDRGVRGAGDRTCPPVWRPNIVWRLMQQMMQHKLCLFSMT